MRHYRITVPISLLLLLAMSLHAGTPGSFRGKIVEGPHPATEKNWIYVQGRNGSARRVDVSHAEVAYDESVPAVARSQTPQDAMVVGANVRVTAEQGSDGEWKATSIEILPSDPGEKATPAGKELQRL